MSISLYAVNEEAQWDCSWWTWRPIWHFIATKLDWEYARGSYNDSHYFDAAAMLEALTGVTAATILKRFADDAKSGEFQRVSGMRMLARDAALYADTVDDKTLSSLRGYLAKHSNHGVVMS